MTAAAPSSKRIEANRRNAGRSTGPKTAEGKERVRLNALKHGLTAATVVLPGEDVAALEARVDAWKDDVRPGGPLEDYLTERAAHASWQLDRADRTIAARLAERMRREPIDRAAREVEEVDTLAWALFWDPLGPVGLYPHVQEPGPLRRLSWTDASTTRSTRRGSSAGSRRSPPAADGCSTAGASCGRSSRTAGDGSRRTGCGPSACWAGSRWTRWTTSGCCRSTWPAAMDPQGRSAFADLCSELERRRRDRVRYAGMHGAARGYSLAPADPGGPAARAARAGRGPGR